MVQTSRGMVYHVYSKQGLDIAVEMAGRVDLRPYAGVRSVVKAAAAQQERMGGQKLTGKQDVTICTAQDVPLRSATLFLG